MKLDWVAFGVVSVLVVSAVVSGYLGQATLASAALGLAGGLLVRYGAVGK